MLKFYLINMTYHTNDISNMFNLDDCFIQSLLKAQLYNRELLQESNEGIIYPRHVKNIALDIKKQNNENDIEGIDKGIPEISTNLLNKTQLNLVCASLRVLETKLTNFKIKADVKKIFIVSKIQDKDPITKTRELVEFILKKFTHVEIYIEEALTKCNVFKFDELVEKNVFHSDRIRFWNSDNVDNQASKYDLIITLGGDGTLLYASWLFQNIMPPIISFKLGSLGFLTRFEFENHEEIVSKVLTDGYKCSMRMRFECTIMKSKNRGTKVYNIVDQINNADKSRDLIKEIKQAECRLHESTKPICEFLTHEKYKTFTVFNDLVIDRGPNSTMTSLELFGDYSHLTTAAADGMIISTPSGSTAYSLSAGGSLIHPEIPGILLTPICPHTLSFRPLVIPESIIVRVGVPYDSRTSAWLSFDGREKVELENGDFITITTSRFPLTFVCGEEESSQSKLHWFMRLNDTLNWNERKKQKSYS